MSRILRIATAAAFLLQCGAWNAVYAQVFRTADTAEPGTVPEGVLYQGRVEDAGVPITGVRNMVFRLFDSLTGGSPLYQSNGGLPTAITLTGGVFGVVLQIPLNTLVGQKQKYIEVEIDNVKLAPRDTLATVPFAKIAETVEGTIDISTGGLSVTNTAGTIFFVSSTTARVGIGTTNPNGRLTVSTTTTTGGTTINGLEMANPSAVNNTGQRLIFNFEPTGTLATYAAIEAIRTNAAASGDTHLAFYTRSASTPGERLRIDPSGRVGINQTSPSAALHVDAGVFPIAMVLDHASLPQLQLRRAGADVLVLDHDGTTGRFGTQTGTDLALLTGNAERLRIESGGDVGIGTTNPARKLDVSGTFRASGVIETSAGGSQAAPAIILGGDPDTGLFQTAGNELRVAVGGSERLRVDSSGNIGIGSVAPGAGERLKIVGGDVVIGNPVGAGGSANPDLFIQGNLVIDGQTVNTGASRFEQLGISTDTIPGQLFKVGKGTMTVLEGGEVGIGLTNPAATLHVLAATTPGLVVNHASNPELRLRRAGTSVLRVEHTGTVGNVGTLANEDLVLLTNGVERLRILGANGRVGISSATPSELLSVQGNASVTGALTLGTDLEIASGGTGSSTQLAAQTALDVPSRGGANASGTWGINISGNAATATQLAADPANCLAGNQFPKGVDAAGVAQSCTDITASEEQVLEGVIYDSDNDVAAYGGSWIVAASGAFDIAFDTNSATDATFYVDSSADRLGIGTTGPSHKLDVQGGNINASGKIKEGGNDLVPANMVMLFNLAACPAGWAEVTAARGRALVGLPGGGTLLGTSGTALTNTQTLTHTHTMASHTHDTAIGSHSHAPGSHTHDLALGSHSHGPGSHTHTTALGGHTHGIGLHTHNFNPSTETSVGPSATTLVTTGGGTSVGSGTHTHDVNIGDTTSSISSGTSGSTSLGTPTSSGPSASNTASTNLGTPTSTTPSASNTAGFNIGTLTSTAPSNNTSDSTAHSMPYIQLIVCVKS